MSHAIGTRLQTALRGIISAVDGLGVHPSRHCPRAVLDAVDEARKVVNAGEQPFRGILADIRANPNYLLPPWVETMRQQTEARMAELRNETGSPSAKRRIYLRGGPLDGCWYLIPRSADSGVAMFDWLWPDGVKVILWYSSPDANGVCDYCP